MEATRHRLYCTHIQWMRLKVTTIMGHIFQQGIARHQRVDIHFTLHGGITAIIAKHGCQFRWLYHWARMGHDKSTVIAQHTIDVPKQNNTLKTYVYQKHIHHSSCFTWCTFQSLAARNWVVLWLPPIENTSTSAHTRLSALSTFLALNEDIQAQKHTVSIPQSNQQLRPAPVFWEGVRLCDRLARKEVLHALPTKTSASSRRRSLHHLGQVY